MEIYHYEIQMKNIVIIGAGDLGKEVAWLIEDINKTRPTYLILGFLDDDVSKSQTSFWGYKVLGKIDQLEWLHSKMSFSAVLAIQDGSVRRKIVESYSQFDNWETIIHPTAVIASSSVIGKGCILFPQVTLSVDSRIGSFCLFYIRSTVCNDCIIGNYISLMTGASISEHAEIGDGCVLASGACVYPNTHLGRYSVVAVEATVERDYDEGSMIGEKGTGFYLVK